MERRKEELRLYSHPHEQAGWTTFMEQRKEELRCILTLDYDSQEQAGWSAGNTERRKEELSLYSLPLEQAHRVHRVATAAFWRTFSDEGKICPGW
jgi:hypothetical protein